MTLLNPMGLLGLLAIPAIVALHFLRSQRRDQEIGGLHLWGFVRERQPVGRRWQRLEGTALLAVQLVAALVVTLLLAGLERHAPATGRHLVVVVDGSASMAGVNASTVRSPAAELSDQLARRVGSEDVVTVVEAGVLPRLVAGPFAAAPEAQQALAAWTPEAPAADLFEAARFARRFAQPSQAIVLATDHPPAAHDLAVAPPGVEWLALGEPAANTAIAYADRRRAEPGRDRVFVVLEHHGAGRASARLSIAAGARQLATREVALDPGTARQFEVEVDAVEEIVTLRLEDDALAADNVVRLAPSPPRTIGWHVVDVGARSRPAIERALAVAPDAFRAVPPESADFVVAEAPVGDHAASAARLAEAFPQARGMLLLAATTDETPLEVAEGDFLPGADAGAALRSLGFEGVLWAHVPSIAARPGDLLTWRGRRLLAELPDEAGAGVRRVWSANIALPASTLARTTAWPLLIDDLVEATRRLLPGPRHRNVALGEALLVSTAGLDDAAWEVHGERGSVRRFERLPSRLAELERGIHVLRAVRGGRDAGDDGAAAWSWTVGVNFFAREESDLRARERAAITWDRVWTRHEEAAARRPVLYYALLALLAALGAAWWALAPPTAPHPAAGTEATRAAARGRSGRPAIAGGGRPR